MVSAGSLNVFHGYLKKHDNLDNHAVTQPFLAW
jgi:hypothetical protein